MKRIKHFFTPSSQKISTIVVGVIMSMTIGTGFAAWNTVKGPGDSILSADWNALVTAVQSKLGVETDPKIGTPTTSYIPKWNGTSLADSALFESGNTKLIIKGATADNQAFGLHVVDSADASKFIVRNDGNVGIGTATPAYALTLAGGSGGAEKIALVNATPATGGKWTLNSHSDGNLYIAEEYGLGNLVTIQKTGNVGIGTTTPGAQLEISSAMDTDQLRMSYNGDLNYRNSIYNHFDGASAATSQMYFKVASGAGTQTEVMRLNGAGNVGIGTASPIGKLEVVNAGGYSAYFTTSANGNGIALGGNMMATGGSISTNQAVPMLFGINGAEKMRLDTNGNVGIGTTTPSAALDVGPGKTIRALSGTVSAPSIGKGLELVYDGGAADQGIIIAYDRTAGAYKNLGLGTSGTQLYLKNDGNVGIGTTMPEYRLDVQGGVSRIGAFNSQTRPASSTSGGVGVTWNYDVGSAGTYFWNLFDSATMAFQFNQKTGASTHTSIMTMLGNGNVGIGTTGPQALLDVRGAATTGTGPLTSVVSIPDTAGNRGGFGVINASGGSLAGFAAQDIATGVYPNSVGRGDIWVQNGATTVNVASFTKDGNVGIGTASPNISGSNTALTVSNTGASKVSSIEIQGNYTTDADVAQILFYNNANYNNAIISRRAGADNSGELDFYTRNAGSFGNRMVISPAGNVGIGTTSPTDILSVGLATNALGGVLVGEGSTKVATLGDASSIGTNGLLELYAAGTKTVQLHALSSQVSYINAGNVGIGTTDPQAKIDVSNASGSNAIFRMTNDGSATAPFDPNYYTIRLINEYSGSTPAANQKPAKIGFRTVTSNGWGAEGAIMLLASGTSSGQGDLVFTTGAASGTDYTTERMRIMGNGNVGIGTTAPAYTLDVNGAINATSVLVNGVAVGSQWTTNGSNIYYSGGNVGIGTTAPGAKLDVGTGGLRVSAAGSDTYASGGYIQLSNTASAQAALQMNASGNLGFWTDNGGLGWVQKMVLTNGGNVGIGTVAPGGYRTAIRGSGDTSATGALWVSGATAVTPGLMVRDDGNVGVGTAAPSHKLTVAGDGYNLRLSNSSNLQGYNIGRNVTDGYLYFYGDETSYDGYVFTGVGGEKMRIQPNGNVGIGITTPVDTLQVNGGISLGGDTLAGNRTRLYEGNGLHLDSGVNTRPILFEIDSAEKMRIDTSGNVGIGTTATPSSTLGYSGPLLHIYGAQPALILQNTDGVAGAAKWEIGTNWFGAGPTPTLTLGVGATYAMAIQSTGNVGIGTTNPTSKLSVIGGALIKGIDQSTNSYLAFSGGTAVENAYISWYKAGVVDTRLAYLGANGGGVGNLGLNLENSASFNINGGNVGIGTTSPGYPLEVVGRIAASSAITTKTRLVENGGFTPNTTYYVKVFTSSGTVEKVSFKMTSSTGSEYGAEVEAFIPAYSSFAGYGTNAMPQISTRVDGLKSQTPTFKNILYTSPSNGVTELWLEFYVDSYASRAISLSENPGSEPVTWAGRTTTPPTNILKTVAFTTAAKTENGLTTTYSGNVGIGTTGPTGKLEVNWDADSAMGGVYLRNTNTGASAYTGIYWGNSTSAVDAFTGLLGTNTTAYGGARSFLLGTNSDSPVVFMTGGAEKFRITSAGNVGIGTTAPGGKLEVNGGAVDTTSFGSNKVLKLSNTSVVDGSRIGIGFSNNESIGSSLAFVEAVSDTHSTGATSLRFSVYNGSTWNSDMMTLKAGNVGIGTPTPTGKLNIGYTIDTAPLSYTNGGNEGFVINATRDVAGASYLGTVDFVAGRGSDATNGGSQFRFLTQPRSAGAPAVAMLIDKSGNVGIGTTNPADILEVKANGTTSSGMIVTAGGTSASVHAFVVRDSALTQLLRVEQNGNVGIGTTDPSTNRLSIVANTSTTGLKIRAGGAGGVPMFDLADGNGNNPIFVSNDGKLGIGTTSPISKLSNNSSGIIGGYGAAGINWDITENGYLAVLRNSSTGSAAGGLYVKADNTGGAPAMYADGEVNLMAGNVGIGTTVPGVKLQLQGTTAAGTPGTEEQLKLTRSIAGSVSYPQAASFALGSYSTNNVGNSYGPDTRLDIKLKSTSVDDFATDATIMTLQDNGNVGIGTTSPGQKLDIDGYVQIRSGSRLRFPTADLTSNFADIYSPTDEGATASPLAFRVGAGEALRIQSGGNVGIGTTTPWKPLSVVGQIYTAGGSADGTANAQGVVINNTGWGSGGGLWKIVSGNTTQRLDFYANTAAASDFSTNNIPLTLLQNGNVGIGTISPGRKLFVNGDAGGTTGWYNDSDARLKKNVTTISGALEKVKNLRGVNFEWKDTTNHPTGNHIGFIAQEAMKVTPEAVDKKGEYYSMDYSSLTAVLVEAVKELSSKVNYLTSRIEELFAKYFDQQQEINDLKALVCLDHPTAKVCKR